MLVVEGLHVMMEVMVANNIFSGYQVCNNDTITISHL